jgi:hypothetical protein
MNKEIISRCVESIEIAFSMVEFTFRLEGGLTLDGIVELFQNEIEVKGTLILRKEMSREEAGNFLYNYLHSSLCTFWIAVDEALYETFGSRKPEGTSFIDDFRAVIYMFRCAFSHKISQPTWRIDPRYRRQYHIIIPLEYREEGISEFHFDFSVLHDQRVKNEEYKSFRGVVVLSRVARGLISTKSLQSEMLAPL